MKKILFIIQTFLFFSCSPQKNGNYTLKVVEYESGNISNTGKLIEESRYINERLVQKILFDSSIYDGLIRKLYYYTTGGKDSIYEFSVGTNVSTRIVYFRDRFGNLVSSKSYDLLNPGDTIKLYFNNILNKDSLAVQTVIMRDTMKLSDNNFIDNTYDSQNRLVEQRVYTIDDTIKQLQSFIQWSYDQSGNSRVIDNFNVIENSGSKIEYDYSQQNELIKERYTENSTLVFEIEYQYSGSRKIKGIKTYSASKNKFIMKYIYSD